MAQAVATNPISDTNSIIIITRITISNIPESIGTNSAIKLIGVSTVSIKQARVRGIRTDVEINPHGGMTTRPNPQSNPDYREYEDMYRYIFDTF